MLGGLKGAKGLHRWREVRRAVALQLMDVEPAVQQAALRSLKVQNQHNRVASVRASCQGAATNRPCPDWAAQIVKSR